MTMSTPSCPYRQIRAHYTKDTITVYQAYNTEIGTAATEEQRLNASPKFSTTRMTWIKPSWAWMLYRSGYSLKDPGQECILALSVQRDVFVALLGTAIVAAPHSIEQAEAKSREASPRVRVQWDPERNMRLEKLPYRSIQIGVPGALVNNLIDGIVRIENVTEQARRLKEVIGKSPEIVLKDLIAIGLVPEETEFVVSKDLEQVLGMPERKSA